MELKARGQRWKEGLNRKCFLQKVSAPTLGSRNAIRRIPYSSGPGFKINLFRDIYILMVPFLYIKVVRIITPLVSKVGVCRGKRQFIEGATRPSRDAAHRRIFRLVDLPQ